MKKVYKLLLLALITITVFNQSSFAQAISSALSLTVTVNTNLTTENKVSISWTVLAKLPTKCFDVEKSNDGISWRSIATVNSNDSASLPFTYTVIDPSPLKGLNFYTVRLKDVNGNFTYTAIKSEWVNVPGKVNVYPNPSSNTVNVILGQVPHADWSIAIINIRGQIMAQKKYSKNTTAVSFAVSTYPAGNYILDIVADNTRQSNHLMINHK